MANNSARSNGDGYPDDMKAEMTATPGQIFDKLDIDGNPDVYADEKELRRILRRIDLRVVPYACLLYLLSL